MEYFFNDLSIHAQFQQAYDFKIAIDTLMQMKNQCAEYGFSLWCDQGVSSRKVSEMYLMQQAVNHYLDTDQRRNFLSWVTKSGPFWDENRLHPENELPECNNEDCTNTALAETAYRVLNEQPSELISLRPSNWTNSPLSVLWQQDGKADQRIDLQNHTQLSTLIASLKRAQKPFASWKELATTCTHNFNGLNFTDDAFSPLQGQPFVLSASNAIYERLQVLNKLYQAKEADGSRTPEGNELYQKHFTGEKAWFSDSSESEKSEFRNDLTFKHPEQENENIFCPWHGKVKTPQFRIHFTWPVRTEDKLYVVYVGPKITKR
jgi:hypothetical protein